jgi:hypothetical protein
MARLLHLPVWMATKKTCAYEECRCGVVDRFIVHRGRKYCSSSCAHGRGCGHGGCDCGARAASKGPSWDFARD